MILTYLLIGIGLQLELFVNVFRMLKNKKVKRFLYIHVKF